MKFVSTRDNKKIISFKKVSLEGLAQDGGLYLPNNWEIKNLSYDKKIFVFRILHSRLLKTL